MKIKSGIVLMIVTVFAFIYSCKKKEDETKQELDAQEQQFNDDSNRYKSESDQADADINDQIRGMSGFGTATPTSSALCGATIDTSLLSQKTVTFVFDGVTQCFSPRRTRSGKIKVQLTSGNLWEEVNAVLTITYDNFKVTRSSDNKSITFNGVKTLKNINGNDWVHFLLGSYIFKYQERAFNIQVNFDNNLHAEWNSARMSEWSYTPNGAYSKLNFSCNGDTAINGIDHVDSWGTNRFGKTFTTYYTSAIHSDTYCGLWTPNSGELVHWVNGRNYILTLGVDRNGNPTPSICGYGYKVTWTGADGTTQSVVISY